MIKIFINPKLSRWPLSSKSRPDPFRNAVDMFKDSARNKPSRPIEPPHTIYRYCSEPEHARDFASAVIRISTLVICRGYEKCGQGDPHDATLIYRNPGRITGNSGDSKIDALAARFRIKTEGCIGVTFDGGTAMDYLRDGYVLCTSEIFDLQALGPTFGYHVVKISEPFEFFKCLGNAMQRERGVNQSLMGRAVYRDIEHSNINESSGVTGFEKGRKFAPQKEVRMLWTIDRTVEMTPFFLEVPECSKYCSVIS